jgi:hypothetical protein
MTMIFDKYDRCYEEGIRIGFCRKGERCRGENLVRVGLNVTATAVTISAKERRIKMDDKKVTLPDGTVVDEATIKNFEGNKEEGK